MRPNRCKHATGSLDAKCGAGIRVRELVGGIIGGWWVRRPCDSTNTTDITCDQYKEPTAEELAEYEKAIKERTDMMVATLPLIAKIKDDHKGQDAAGQSECPVCGNELVWRHAACNGHVWGKCKTENCLAWME